MDKQLIFIDVEQMIDDILYGLQKEEAISILEEMSSIIESKKKKYE